MIYIIIGAIALAVAAGGGFYGGYSWEAGAWAKETAKRQEAEAKLVEQGRQLAQEVANHEQDLVTAYDAGQAKAKTVYVQVKAKAVSDVANYPVFADRKCDWPADVVQYVNDSFASLSAPANTRVSAPAVPGPVLDHAAAGGRNTGVDPAGVRKDSAGVESVPSTTRDASGSGALPASQLQSGTRPAKPVPRGK